MAAKYARIPFGSRLEFPAQCPFSGAKNPRHAVVVTRSEKQMWLPIPFIGHFSLSKTGQLRFPASTIIAWGDRFWSILFWILLVAGFALGIVRKADPNFGYYIFGGVAGAFLVRILHWLWLFRVRIVRIGMSSLEVRFGSEEYAKEFCRLNEFNCRDHPSQKRATPITVNDVR